MKTKDSRYLKKIINLFAFFITFNFFTFISLLPDDITVLAFAIDKEEHKILTRDVNQNHSQKTVDHIAQRTKQSPKRKLPKDEMETEEDVTADDYDEDTKNDSSPEGQNFFQSFAPLFASPPIGHSRPMLYPEHFRSSYRARDLQFANSGDSLLGSGNFGVVKGGTYYASDRDTNSDFNLDDSYSSFLGNGHSRPAYHKRNPLPAYRNGGDFFANFRDFADITAPRSAFSEYYVVYVNKNSTIAETEGANDNKQKIIPKNIIEQLDMMDNGDGNSEEKKSKFKIKYEQYKERVDNKEAAAKSKNFSPPKDVAEPLLALS